MGTAGDKRALARVTGGGSRDATFGVDGMVTANVAGGACDAVGYALEVGPDGRVTVVGEANYSFGVARYLMPAGLEERLYAQQDANFNVTSIVDVFGEVVERYEYAPYGERAVLDADFTPDSSGGGDGLSDVGFLHGHQGGRHDLVTGLVHFRRREYSPALGRWVRQDPLGYVDGASRYQALSSSPASCIDAFGTQIGMPDRTSFNDEGPFVDVPQSTCNHGWTITDAEAELRKTIWEWRPMGWQFAADLLSAFVNGRRPAEDAFQKHADAIRTNPQYREAAERYWTMQARHFANGVKDNDDFRAGKWMVVRFVKMDPRNPRTIAFDVTFNRLIGVGNNILKDDLGAALGTGHFGWDSAELRFRCLTRTLVLPSGKRVRESGLEIKVEADMLQSDYYHFPGGLREIFPSYEAARRLQEDSSGLWKPFWHTEKWKDSFHVKWASRDE